MWKREGGEGKGRGGAAGGGKKGKMGRMGRWWKMVQKVGYLCRFNVGIQTKNSGVSPVD
jgi:hypothetical protein